MPWKFNPFSVTLDQTGSGGGGGGAQYIDGEVATYNDLPLDGTAAADSAWLVREASGTWLIGRKPAGIYIRTATAGVSRDADYTYAGIFPDVFADSAFTVYSAGDSTKTVQLSASGITAGTNRVVSLPDKNITLDDSGDSRTPTAHKNSHSIGQADFLAPSDIGAQSIFDAVNVTENIETSPHQLSALRAQRVRVATTNDFTIRLPESGHQSGDIVEIFAATLAATKIITIQRGVGSTAWATLATITTQNAKIRIVAEGTGRSNWQQDSYFTTNGTLGAPAVHTHAAADITSGTLDIARIPTGTSSSTVCIGDDARLSDARTPTSHTHGNLTNDGKIGSTSGLPLKTGTAGVVEAGAFGVNAGEFAEGNHTHSQLHDRSHAITSTSDHTAGNHKVFYSNGSGEIVELALGNSGEVLTSNGATSAPSFSAASGGVGGGSGSVDNAIIRADGTGGSTVQSSAFLIADNATASPNNTVNHASIQATGDSTNVSVSIVPKGTGAFMLQVPDGTSTGGNARGARAVDLQSNRSSATQVASGADSFIAGGIQNTASGSYSFVGCGVGNVASGGYSACIGSWLGTASAGRSVTVASYFSTASGDQSIVISGNSSSATAEGAVAIGRSSTADVVNLIAEGNGGFGAQHLRFNLRGTTTTNSAVELFGGNGSNRLRCPSGKAMFMTVKVLGIVNGGGTVATFERQYAIKNVSGTTSEVYAPVTIGTDNAESTSIALSANDTNDALKIEVTGLSATTIRWSAHVSAIEMSYG